MSVNTKDNIYYEKRNHIRLAKDDMTKDEIFPVIFGEEGGDPIEGFLRVYSDIEQRVFSDDERMVYIAA